MIKEIEENNRMGKIRNLFKKMGGNAESSQPAILERASPFN